MFLSGPATTSASGDYVSTVLASQFRFRAEVPPATGALSFQIFDADISGANDVIQGVGLNTATRYRVLDPTGATIYDFTCDATGNCNGFDNLWATFPDIAAPTAGHWTFLVDTQSTPAGDDVNGFGIRVADGQANVGAGGVEINVYADTQTMWGALGGGASATVTQHPYITSGCDFTHNDFDVDDSLTTDGGSTSLSSRTGAFSANVGLLSGDNTWLASAITGWTTDQKAIDYGIWSQDFTLVAAPTAGGNLASVWIADPFGAAPPPTAQPEPNSFRIYIGTDVGGTPLKPYFEQELTFKSGTSPPAVGATTRVAVTVRMTNPTPHAITSGQALTTVPGGGAVYAGNAQTSAGSSVTSAPSVGGTGNVVWNVGTVAAGATALLAYEIDVTPTSAGQRIPVTGPVNPTTGSTALYSDETGTAFQAGPLCELAITEALAFYANVDSVEAIDHKDGPLVRWSTSSEIGTVGFHVERSDDGGPFVRVSDTLLGSPRPTPQGGHYTFVDRSRPVAGSTRYRVLEVDRMGRTDVAAATLVDRRRVMTAKPVTSFVARAVKERPVATAIDASEAPQIIKKASGGNGPLKFTVDRPGIVALALSDIAAESGQTLSAISLAANARAVSIKRSDVEVPWTLAPTGDAILFYAQPHRDLWSTAQYYLLELTSGTTMATRAAVAPDAGAVFQPAFDHKALFDTDVFAATVTATDPNADYWFMDVVSTPGAPTSIGFELPDALQPQHAATVDITLVGASTINVAGEHQIAVNINGQHVGDFVFEGIQSRTRTFTVDPNVLLRGQNTVTLTGSLANGVQHSYVYVQDFAVTYRRAFEGAPGTQLWFAPDDTQPVAVTRLQGNAPLLFDISDPQSPVQLTDLQVVPDGGSSALRFEPANVERYLVVEPSDLIAPTRLWRDPVSDLRAQTNRADFVVITIDALAAQAQRLADLRTSQGLNSKVVRLEDVYDEFGHGAPSPYAIKAFIAHAYAHWSLPPRYVVLAGAGSFDHRNIQGLGGNAIPVLMSPTPDGLFATDALFGDVDGDGAPEVAVGRLPAANAIELSRIVDKLLNYAADDGLGWSDHAIVVADSPDEAADFSAVAGSMAGLARTTTFETIEHAVHGEQSGDRLIDALDDGAGWLSYVGHGGLDRLGQNILSSATVAELDNGDTLPIMTALTCSMSRFAVPGFDSLGETLIASEAGAVAVWAATGLADVGPSRELGLQLARAMGDSTTERFGDAMLSAQQLYAARGGDRHHLSTYTLLGDPAVQLKRAPQDDPGEPTDDLGGADTTPFTDVSGIDSPARSLIDPPRRSGGCSIGSESPGTPFFVWFFVLVLSHKLRKIA